MVTPADRRDLPRKGWKPGDGGGYHRWVDAWGYPVRRFGPAHHMGTLNVPTLGGHDHDA